MEYQAIKVIPLSESRKVIACFGRMVVVELDDDCTLYKSASVERGKDIGANKSSFDGYFGGHAGQS